MATWYEENIEEPIRSLVKLLRDNGFNTTSSCGHAPKPYVQMDWLSDDDITKLYVLLMGSGFKNFQVVAYWSKFDDQDSRVLEVKFFTKSKLINESEIRDAEGGERDV